MPQAVATSAQMAARLTDTRAADNFRNLFELPVLFYLALFVAALTGLVTSISIGLAWAFVVLRMLHSVVHCTLQQGDAPVRRCMSRAHWCCGRCGACSRWVQAW